MLETSLIADEDCSCIVYHGRISRLLPNNDCKLLHSHRRPIQGAVINADIAAPRRVEECTYARERRDRSGRLLRENLKEWNGIGLEMSEADTWNDQ